MLEEVALMQYDNITLLLNMLVIPHDAYPVPSYTWSNILLLWLTLLPLNHHFVWSIARCGKTTVFFFSLAQLVAAEANLTR